MYDVASLIVLTVVPWQILVILGISIALIPVGFLTFQSGSALTSANNASAPFFGVPLQFFSASIILTGLFLFVFHAVRLFGILVVL